MLVHFFSCMVSLSCVLLTLCRVSEDLFGHGGGGLGFCADSGGSFALSSYLCEIRFHC